jgi:DNA repair exonuclease SbcCD nuclease subunit
MKKYDAILTADWHLRANKPICRTDDFTKAMWQKVEAIFSLGRTHKCPILLAGDLGHYNQWPNWLIEKFMEFVNIYHVKIISIPGQHDLPEHNLALKHKSGYGILERSNFIINAGIEHHMGIFVACSFPYGEKIAESDPEIKAKSIAIAHQMVIEDKPEWPGQVADSALSLLRKFPEYRLILTGDNHKSFVVEYEGRILVNPGSIMRTTADQIDHKPVVFLWRASNNKVTPVYLPIEQDVIDRSHIDIKREKDQRINAYTERLSERYELGLSFEGNLEEHFKVNRIRKPVKDRIWEACER